jgi:alpha-methylacyl-CoA racemase
MLSNFNDEQEKPLQHLRILDFTTFVSGPLVTRLLAQYGAEIIKVEPVPDGDPGRGLLGKGWSAWLNQGKKSLAIDLTTPEGQEAVRSIAAEVDVVIENSRENVMEKWGLGYQALSELNPELLYVSLRGFKGKNAAKAGHGLNAAAASGVGEWFLKESPKAYGEWSETVAGALIPAVKILAHLSNPDRRGMHLVSTIEESVRTLFLPRAVEEAQNEFEKPLEPSERADARSYLCSDSHWISVGAIQTKHWERFCEAIGQPSWRNRQSDPELNAELESVFSQQPSNYWEALMANYDVCVFRVVPWSEVQSDPSSRAQLLEDPLSWAGFAHFQELGASDTVGKDTEALLMEYGLDEDQIAELRSQKTIS